MARGVAFGFGDAEIVGQQDGLQILPDQEKSKL